MPEIAAPPPIKPRRRFVAVIFAIFGFGCGLAQLYNGQARKAMLFLALYFTLAASIGLLFETFAGYLVIVLIALLLLPVAVVDAFLTARTQRAYVLKPYNRWYVYILYYVLVILAMKQFHLENFRRDYFEAFKVPAASMEDTILAGDFILVKKSQYQHAPPARGDVVVFTRPAELGVTIIKRIVGIPGDLVELKGEQLFVNTQLVYEPYAKYVRAGDIGFGPATVPEGKLFLLGDNRDLSKDSRFWTDAEGKPEPFLESYLLKGKALYTYWNSKFNFKNIGRRLG